jgi:hypothetical protein
VPVQQDARDHHEHADKFHATQLRGAPHREREPGHAMVGHVLEDRFIEEGEFFLPEDVLEHAAEHPGTGHERDECDRERQAKRTLWAESADQEVEFATIPALKSYEPRTFSGGLHPRLDLVGMCGHPRGDHADDGQDGGKNPKHEFRVSNDGGKHRKQRRN